MEPPKLTALSTESVGVASLEKGETGLSPIGRRPWRRHITSNTRIAKERWQGDGTTLNPYIVNWLADDAENPLNWNGGYKAFITTLVSLPSFALSLGSGAFIGAIPGLEERFPGHKIEVYLAGMSTFIFGLAIGPLMFAPASEVFGRRALAIISGALFTVFSIALCFSPNVWATIVFRFLGGAMGSSSISNSGGTISDIYTSEKRGIAMGVFALSPIIGPTIGPIASGFIGQTKNGDIWVYVLMAATVGMSWLADWLWQPETYAPVLLRWRAERLSKATGKVFRSVYEKQQEVTIKGVMKTALIRPWALLFREPIVFLLSAYLAIIYAILFLLFAELPYVFELRGWEDGMAGLTFTGILIGCLLGAFYMIVFENPRYTDISRQQQGFAPPEARLLPTMIGGVVIPIGLFWFAWTAMPISIHWSVCIIATVPFAFGLTLIFLSILMYLVDAYMIYAASALAGNAVFRSVLGAVFPLIEPRLIAKLGVNWSGTLLAFIALICTPIPFAFYRWGPAIRERCPYGKQAAAVRRFVRDHIARQRAAEALEDRVTGITAQEPVLRRVGPVVSRDQASYTPTTLEKVLEEDEIELDETPMQFAARKADEDGWPKSLDLVERPEWPKVEPVSPGANSDDTLFDRH